MNLDYIVSVFYSEDDKNVSKPQITEKPAPAYPSSQLSEKLKGKVSVNVMFFAAGTLKVLGVNSVMPREFDKAAMEAAAKIKFEPAVHKKSKKPVSQVMAVEYEFKP
jgi:TonB family protein